MTDFAAPLYAYTLLDLLLPFLIGIRYARYATTVTKSLELLLLSSVSSWDVEVAPW